MKKVSIFVSIVTILALTGLMVTPHYVNEEMQTILLNGSLGGILIIHVLLLAGYLLCSTIEKDMNFIDQQFSLSDEDLDEEAFDEGMYNDKPQCGRRKASRKNK